MVIEQLKELAVIPVATLQNTDNVKLLGDALLEGGLPCAEVTLRSNFALEAIQILAARKEILVGAGTVLSIENARKARKAGAEFLVSPGFNPKIVEWCIDHDVPIFPGTATATEIQLAMEMGLDTVKYFPAESLGGVKTIRALGNAFTTMKFIPTGGINLENLGEYLLYPQIIACGGSWMVNSNWIQSGNFKKIIAETRKTVKLVKNIRAQD